MEPRTFHRPLAAALVVALAVWVVTSTAARVQAAPPLPALPVPPTAASLTGGVVTLSTLVPVSGGACPPSGGTVLTQDYWDSLGIQSGDRVVFGAGCYYVPDELRLDGATPLADVVFDGTAGGGVHLVQSNPQTCTTCAVGGVVSLANHSTRVTIQGFVIEGSAPEGGTASIDRSNYDLPVNNTRMGLRLGNVSDITVSDVEVRDSWSDAFYLSFVTRVLLVDVVASYSGRNFVSMNPAEDVEIRHANFRRSAMAGIDLEPGRTVVDNRIEIDGSFLSWVGGGWAGGAAAPFVARTAGTSWCTSAAGDTCFGKLYVLSARDIGGAPNVTNITITGNTADVPLRIQINPVQVGARLDEIALINNTTTWASQNDVDQSWIALGDSVAGMNMTNVSIIGTKITTAGTAAAPFIDYYAVAPAPVGSCGAVPGTDPYHIWNRYRDADNASQVWRIRIGFYHPGAFGQSPLANSTICS